MIPKALRLAHSRPAPLRAALFEILRWHPNRSATQPPRRSSSPNSPTATEALAKSVATCREWFANRRSPCGGDAKPLPRGCGSAPRESPHRGRALPLFSGVKFSAGNEGAAVARGSYDDGASSPCGAQNSAANTGAAGGPANEMGDLSFELVNPLWLFFQPTAPPFAASAPALIRPHPAQKS